MNWTNLERDVFCDAFHYVFTSAEIIDLEVKCQAHVRVGDFYLYYDNEEFYFINLESGMIVQYYKHLGRCNGINCECTVRELIGFLTKLRKDLHDENI